MKADIILSAFGSPAPYLWLLAVAVGLLAGAWVVRLASPDAADYREPGCAAWVSVITQIGLALAAIVAALAFVAAWVIL